MIKRNAWKVIVIALVVLLYFGYIKITARERYLNVNTQSSKAHPLNHEIHFHTDQVVHILRKNGIQMTKEKNDSSSYDLAGVHPVIYQLNHHKNYRVFLYVFHSLNDREKVTQKLEESFGSPFSPEKSRNSYVKYLYGYDESWNVLFLFPVSADMMKSNFKGFQKIKSVIFHDLNDGKTQIYKGKTAHWDATFNYRYYIHWYKNDVGSVVNDGEGSGVFEATYKGAEQVLDHVSVGYNVPSSSSTLKVTTFKTSKPMKLNYSKTNAILYSYEKPKMTFQWDDKKESVVLQPQD